MITKTQILHILSLFVIFIIINTIIDQLVKYKVNYISSTQDKQYAKLPQKPNILILGDSYSFDELNPMTIGNCFNFGISAENFVQTYFKLKYILDKYPDKKPDTILLSCNFTSFISFRLVNFNNSYWAKHIDFIELYRFTHDKKYIYKSVTEYFFAYVGQYEQLTKLLATPKHFVHPPIVNGFKINKKSKVFAKRPIKNKQILKVQRVYFENQDLSNPLLIHYFEKIMELCEKENIKVILISTPWYKDFYEESVSNYPLLKVQDFINKEISKYPKIITYIDLKKAFFDQPTFFRNNDHLNGSGSDSLSKLVKLKIQKLSDVNR